MKKRAIRKDFYVEIHRSLGRFLSIFYPPAQYSKMSITISVGKENFILNKKIKGLSILSKILIIYILFYFVIGSVPIRAVPNDLYI